MRRIATGIVLVSAVAALVGMASLAAVRVAWSPFIAFVGLMVVAQAVSLFAATRAERQPLRRARAGALAA